MIACVENTSFFLVHSRPLGLTLTPVSEGIDPDWSVDPFFMFFLYQPWRFLPITNFNSCGSNRTLPDFTIVLSIKHWKTGTQWSYDFPDNDHAMQRRPWSRASLKTPVWWNTMHRSSAELYFRLVRWDFVIDFMGNSHDRIHMDPLEPSRSKFWNKQRGIP